MGLVWRRRVRLDDDTDANLSKSGASVSPDRASATAEQPRGGRVVPDPARPVLAVREAPLSNAVGVAGDVMDNGDGPGSGEHTWGRLSPAARYLSFRRRPC